MKHIAKRSFSMVLVLAMVISLFAGLTLNASAAQPTSANDVQYVTSGQYVYNWGKRDTAATFLTTYAQQYYTGNYTYEKLSALSGSSATGTGFYTSAMGTAIHNMLLAKQTKTTSYEAVKTLFQYSECEESSKTQISSYYSGVSMGSTWGNGWNREHTWPNSKGLDGQDENDVLMLKPTLETENSSRGNTAYGEGSGYYDPNENGQQLHGDVARMMLQHLMRWGNTSKFYGSGGVMESRAVLLKWMQEDPVDTWEMGRNDSIQQITGVRNVFVDYPELGFMLLGENVPANYPTPSQSGGTVIPAQEYTVSFNVPNGVTRPASVTASRVTLPAPTGNPTGDYTYTFKGWVEAIVDNDTAKPANIHTAGEQLALSEDITLYALYSYTAGGTGGSATTFNKITTEGELADGASYVFVSTVTGDALSQDVASNWAKTGGNYSGSSIEEPAATDVWTISGGVISCVNGNLYSSAAKAISLSSSTTTWTFTVSGGVWTIASGNNVLSFNSSGWRPYSGGYGSDKTFYIFKSGVGGGTTYYTTVIGTECNHTYTAVETAPTCTADGYTTYTCSKCGFSYTDNAAAALGHHYDPETGVCTVCGYAAEGTTLKITSAALVLNGKIDVVYTAEVPAGYTNARMVFTGPNGDMTVTDYAVNADGNYCFTYTGINPQCMGDNISATLYATKNGIEESVTKDNYSVRQYCVNKLADSSVTGMLRTLISDILAYGASAQTYMSYKTSALVNTGADIVNPTYSDFSAVSGFAPTFDGAAAADVRWVAAGLTLTDSVAMTFRFYAESVDGLTITSAINGRSQTFTADDFVSVDGKANTYEISVTGINATEFASDVTASFVCGGAQIGNTVSYSVNAYVCAKQSSTDENLAALVKAIYNYGASAAALAD